MLSPANQTHFSLTIDGFEHDFQVLAFSGEESISKPYFFNVELVGQRPDLDLQRLFDAQAFLALDAQGNGIHGRIYHIARGSNAQGLTHYNLALVPHLSYLRHRINQRIYQQFSVPKIVALILEEHGILGDAYRFELGSTYPARDYCTQYDETDLHFVQRLCEEEGIHFNFQHSAQGHVLVFGDDRAAYRNRFPSLALDPCDLPPLVHQKPRAPGNQTALVIALEDQASPCDRRLKRVKVKFPWDREGRFDDKSSCWLEGAANWRCELTPLRPGVEVRVAFLENDPDQPLISGCLCCS